MLMEHAGSEDEWPRGEI